ncbi:MAG: hypothetical protein K2M12_05460 [Muribaculaceae bacterium]|nr:hypothetical protein [Muribaculaceae bacterium]
MKKQILAIAAIACGIAASAAGFTVSEKMKLHPELNPELKGVQAPASVVPFKAPAKAAAEGEVPEIYYTMAGDPYTALAFNNQAPGMQIAMAFQFDPQFIANLTDGEITGISYYTGCQMDNEDLNKITKAYVFITNDLTASSFLYTQEVTAPTTSFTKVDVELDEPFAVPAGGKLYCGVYFNVNDVNNGAVVVDYTAHINDLGGWVATRSSSKGQWYWQNISASYGFMTLGATIRGNGMPENKVKMLAVDGMPVSYEDQPFSFDFMLQNEGVNAVENITVEYGIDNEETVTQVFTLNQPMGFNQVLIGSVGDFVAYEPTKNSNVSIKITEVNGNPNLSETSAGSYPVVIVPEGKGLDRNVVIEEVTSIRCPYCPVGYTTMEEVHEKCTDGTIIPVCIHVDFNGKDPMTASTYSSVVNNFTDQTVPAATLNRTWSQYPSPYDEVIAFAEEIKALPAIAAVSAEASMEEGTRKITIDSKTTFTFDYEDGNQNFILAYGITEDEVGPYTQFNGYNGYTSEVPGGWQDLPPTVELVYNDVARQLDRYTGITGSVPAVLNYGEEYSFSHTLTLNKSVTDMSKIHIVVYLLNRKTGAIENACVLKSPLSTGIENVVSDAANEAPVEFFNLQGVRVANPENGLYIRRQGNEVSKVVVK